MKQATFAQTRYVWHVPLVLEAFNYWRTSYLPETRVHFHSFYFGRINGASLLLIFHNSTVYVTFYVGSIRYNFS